MIQNNSVIGFGGGFCSGKTTACGILKKTHQFKEKNFADRLKVLSQELFGMNTKDRSLLQNFGVSVRNINENAWADIIKKEIDAENFTRICIGDVRFENELLMIQDMTVKYKNALSIYIDTPLEKRIERHILVYGKEPTKEQIEHVSETIDKNLFDLVIQNTGSKDDLEKELVLIADEFLKIEKSLIGVTINLEIDQKTFELTTRVKTDSYELEKYFQKLLKPETGVKLINIKKS